MRVSIINSNLAAKDGVGQSILEQFQFFQDRGHEVQIYTLFPPKDVTEDVVNATKIVTLDDLLARRHNHFANSDIYIYHYPIMYPLMESIKSIQQGFVIFYYYNVTPANLWGTDFSIEMLHIGYAAVARLAPYADLIVTTSEFNAEQLVSEHGCDKDKICVIPLTVHLENFQPDTPDQNLVRQYGLENRRVILFVGRFAGNKRTDLLVEALPLVQEKIPNAILLLVGDGETNPVHIEIKGRVCQRARELGLEEDVVFAGIVEDLPAHYRLADVYATASLHEGFGIPLIEAMASGVPVVASNATSHPGVVGDAGLLCEPDNAKCLAERIVQVLTDQLLYDDLVQRGLKRADNFSEDASIRRWVSLIKQIKPVRRAAPTLDTTSADLVDQIEQLKVSANVMLPDYTVRSGLPIIGPLIAWIRRNLTSHLREPYLDPMFHRQETFNQQIVRTLLTMSPHDIDLMLQNRYTTESSQRLQWIETQISLLSVRLSLVEAQRQIESDGDGIDQILLDDLHNRVEDLQQILGHTPTKITIQEKPETI